MIPDDISLKIRKKIDEVLGNGAIPIFSREITGNEYLVQCKYPTCGGTYHIMNLSFDSEGTHLKTGYCSRA